VRLRLREGIELRWRGEVMVMVFARFAGGEW
jgi:hypothetical protein